jgi:PKD repeat protein
MKDQSVFLGGMILCLLLFLAGPVSADKPVASFITNSTSGGTPFSVQFMDSSLNSPTGWTWLFGDGGTAYVQNPVHTYTTSGSYTITLIAKNAAGSDTLTKTGYITALKQAAVPEVSFATNVTGGTAPLSIQFIDTSTNAPTSWVWSFGDGSTTTGPDPVHTYTTDGTYTVTLTATNSAGSNTISRTAYITVSRATDPPTAIFKATKTSGGSPLDVQFMDASTNSPSAWTWSFGDGSTSTLANPTHTYTAPGSYTVTLTATNSQGSDTTSQTGYITVTASLPIASFTANVTSGAKPLVVQFTDISNNTPTGWYWTFGDGGTSTLQNPVYTYTALGTYAVSLGASNSAGSNTTTQSGYITVSNAVTPPTASFTADIQSGTAPLTVKFIDTSTNSPTGWQWAFGDGLLNTEENPSHTYTSAGTYTVSLTAINSGGKNVSMMPGYITVAAPAATVTPTAIPTTLAGTSQMTASVQDTTTPVVTTTAAATGTGPSWVLPLIGGVILVVIILAVLLHIRGGGRGGSRGRYRRGDL